MIGLGVSVRIFSNNLYHVILALAVSHCTPDAATTDTLKNISSIHSGVQNIVGWGEGKPKSQITSNKEIQKKTSYSSSKVIDTSTTKSLYTLRGFFL